MVEATDAADGPQATRHTVGGLINFVTTGGEPLVSSAKHRMVDSGRKDIPRPHHDTMAYVVTDNCIDCKYTSCAAVCPVEAFHEGPDRLYINPETCIDCNACVPECPVKAIYAESELPPQWVGALDEARREASKYPVITEVKGALRGPRCVDPKAG